jgi:hypothetical protein
VGSNKENVRTDSDTIDPIPTTLVIVLSDLKWLSKSDIARLDTKVESQQLHMHA